MCFDSILESIGSWQQELEVGGHSASIVRKLSKLDAHAQPLPLSSYSVFRVYSYLSAPNLEMPPRHV